MTRISIFPVIALVIAAMAMGAAMAIPAALAATYYVSATGSDTTGDGTYTNPWKTISKGVGSMASGDTLIVRNGTYSGIANFIGRNGITVKNGTVTTYTRIMAETPFKVRITRGNDTPGYYDSMLYLNGSSYVEVDGFIFDMNTASENPESTVLIINSNHIKVKRCAVKRSGYTTRWNDVFAIGDSTYVLVEDCSVVGNIRYGFYVGGPSDTSRYIIFRRCVSRADYSNTTEPKASFCVYGNDSGYGVQDVLFQNCIAIDSYDTGPTSGERTYGGYYNPKNVKNVIYRGCIALNVQAYHSSFFVKELGGTGIKMDNCVVWGASNDSGIRFTSSGDGVDIQQVTVGASPNAFHNSSTGTAQYLRNSLFYHNSGFNNGSGSWNVVDYNYFNPASQATGTNAKTAGLVLRYLLRVEDDSSTKGGGAGGADIGATIIKKIGVDGTLWGEDGYNTVTTTDLWPWPYEDEIRSLFRETNTPPPGYVPSTNDTTRGFCADGQTLTNYIWSYLGNPTPPEYRTGSRVPASPTNVRVQ